MYIYIYMYILYIYYIYYIYIIYILYVTACSGGWQLLPRVPGSPVSALSCIGTSMARPILGPRGRGETSDLGHGKG